MLTSYYVDALVRTACAMDIPRPLTRSLRASGRHYENGRSTTLATVIVFLVAAAVFLSACASGAPAPLPPQPGNEPPPGFFPTTPITTSGVATDNLYTLTFAIAAIVFFLVEGLLIWIVIRYRRRPTDTELPPQTHGSNPFELLWTIIPAITVTLLFIGALITLNENFNTSADTPEVTIDVTGFQWQWTFDYEHRACPSRVPVSSAQRWPCRSTRWCASACTPPT